MFAFDDIVSTLLSDKQFIVEALPLLNFTFKSLLPEHKGGTTKEKFHEVLASHWKQFSKSFFQTSGLKYKFQILLCTEYWTFRNISPWVILHYQARVKTWKELFFFQFSKFSKRQLFRAAILLICYIVLQIQRDIET